MFVLVAFVEFEVFDVTFVLVTFVEFEVFDVTFVLVALVVVFAETV